MSMYYRYTPKQNNTNQHSENKQTPRSTNKNVGTQGKERGKTGTAASSGGCRCTERPDKNIGQPRRSRQNTTPQKNMCGDARRCENNKKQTRNFVAGLIPPALYNPESKKVLGIFSAEDLLLAALIIILLDNDSNEDPMLIYALIYILISDYVDLPF